ncbi:PREDICTED: DNA topoisomerase 2-alpha-like [Priapulus caudatus]|uniref:DNA topoisomerase 2 n=1 Tax=Priapulus caudatus TaxID=37621 RepID=A0ABM1E1X2_PRICU|nr:PREDICTED: DNA topoisomerase 2-alpha-like [Priapulus caudatus]
MLNKLRLLASSSISSAGINRCMMSSSSNANSKPLGPHQLQSIFGNKAIMDDDMEDMDDMFAKKSSKAKGGGDGKAANKRLSVERIYQKKSQLEHILLRPDTYIGSVEHVKQQMWVFDPETNEGKGGMVTREISIVPGLYKIFDEILVNAADNKQRDKNMNCIKVNIDPENNKVSIWNNGKGIPIVEHKVEKIFVPELIFGHLLTSSNYDDSQKKITGGRNGYGAKLCNIFSTKFTCVTACKEYGKKFKQTWSDNMTKAGKQGESPDVPGCDDYTEIHVLEPRTCQKFRWLTDFPAFLGVKNFQDYVHLYTKGRTSEDGTDLKVCNERVNDRWEVAVALSEKGFQQVSFVNSIATTKGGRHVDYVGDQLVGKLMEVVKKKNKGGVNVKPFQVKSHMWLFVNCLIENPAFDSQTKENMTLQAKSFGSKCQLSDKFVNQVMKIGIVESIMSWVTFKEQTQLNKKCAAVKRSKLRGVPKLDDANDAGTKNSNECTLILTEGDSAKTLAVSGLAIVGRDRYGVFPLRGKVLNVREASHKQIMENAEINNIIKIMGLQYKKNYSTMEDLKTLRYGRLMIMTDQDVDGSHIKGLLINFIHHNWPSLLKLPFLEEFITPIVKVSKGKQEFPFFSLPEFDEWKLVTENWHTWKVKYYKGLGTSTSKEAKEYFSDMERHRIKFKYQGTEDDSSIVLAFGKKKIEERKEWLTNGLRERKDRREIGLSEIYLYEKDTKAVTYTEFVNKELIQFSIYDNERSIPSLVDGLKPGQRKVLFTCLKRNDKREVKVVQLGGSVAELSAYHHGEQSLNTTIVNLAQNFVGSNNINLLQPIGQFGTRLHGGKDCASPRYIFTMLSSLTRLLIHPHDEPSLNHLWDDNQKIEPEYYCPIIPLVLVNGAEGIGTGWSCKVTNYDPRQIVRNIRLLMRDQECEPMLPFFKNFKGDIQSLSEDRVVVTGEVSVIDDTTVEISELPVRTWTQAYKESVLEPMILGTDKTPAQILDYKEYHTDTSVRFVIKMSEEKLYQAEAFGLHKFFKLQTTLALSNMMLFDENSCIKKYTSALEILKEFYVMRLARYDIRKAYLDGILTAESLKLDNQARFILEKIEGTIVIENKKKVDIIKMLVDRGYDSDPVKLWKQSQQQKEVADAGDGDTEDEDAGPRDGPDYDYLVGMSMWNLTKERKDEILKKKNDKAVELMVLRGKSGADLWVEDLDAFLEELDKQEARELEDEQSGITKTKKTAKGRVAKVKKCNKEETKPSPMGRRVVPVIDAELRKKAAMANEVKGRAKAKKTMVKLEFDGEGSDEESTKVANGDDGEMKPLSERLETKKVVRKPKEDAKQPKISFKPLKKPPIVEEEEIIIPREKTERRAAVAKAKYTFSDNEDEDGGNERGSDDNDDNDGDNITSPLPSEDDYDANSTDDDDFMPTKAKSPRKVAKPRSPRKAPQKKAAPILIDDDDDDSISGIAAPSSAEETRKKVANLIENIPSDSDEEANFPSLMDRVSPQASKPTGAAKKTAGPKSKTADKDEKKKVNRQSKPAKKDDKQPSILLSMGKLSEKRKADDSDDSVQEVHAKKKPAGKKFLYSSEEEEEVVPKAKKVAAPRKKATKKPAVDSDSASDIAFSPKKKAPPKKKPKKKATSDDDDDDEDFDNILKNVAAKERPGRSRQPVKYKFDDDDGDSDF